MMTLEEMKEELGQAAGTFDADMAYQDTAAKMVLDLMDENEKIMAAAREARADAELLAERFTSVFSAIKSHSS